jgi:hypothetical protein
MFKKRQYNFEYCTTANACLVSQDPVVFLDNARCYGQPEPSATFFGAEEGIEQTRFNFRGNSFSSVLH